MTERDEIDNIMLLAMSEHHSGKSEEAFRIVRAQRAALEAAGWRVVPVEATDAMIRAVDAGLHDKWPNAKAMAVAAYQNMLAAAPGGKDEQ